MANEWDLDKELEYIEDVVELINISIDEKVREFLEDKVDWRNDNAVDEEIGHIRRVKLLFNESSDEFLSCYRSSLQKRFWGFTGELPMTQLERRRVEELIDILWTGRKVGV